NGEHDLAVEYLNTPVVPLAEHALRHLHLTQLHLRAGSRAADVHSRILGGHPGAVELREIQLPVGATRLFIGAELGIVLHPDGRAETVDKLIGDRTGAHGETEVAGRDLGQVDARRTVPGDLISGTGRDAGIIR